MAVNFNEVDSFVTKLKFLTSAGCKASVNITSDGGQVRVTLSADLGFCVPPPVDQAHSVLPSRRKRGPAYQRRQQRRQNVSISSTTDPTENVQDQVAIEEKSNSLKNNDAGKVSDIDDVALVAVNTVDAMSNLST